MKAAPFWKSIKEGVGSSINSATTGPLIIVSSFVKWGGVGGGGAVAFTLDLMIPRWFVEHLEGWNVRWSYKVGLPYPSTLLSRTALNISLLSTKFQLQLKVYCDLKSGEDGTSLVVQWLRVLLPM